MRACQVRGPERRRSANYAALRRFAPVWRLVEQLEQMPQDTQPNHPEQTHHFDRSQFRRSRRASGEHEELPEWGYVTDEPLLTKEQEIDLIRRAQDGETQARDQLVRANLRLVFSIAHRFRCRMLGLEDLVQEGIIGLMTAVDRFDLSRGCRLSTYATHWIRQAISRSIEQNDRLIRLPVHAGAELRKVHRAAKTLQQRQEREPSVDDLAQATDLSPERVRHLLDSNLEPVSLETLVGTDSDIPLSDFTCDERVSDPADDTVNHESRAELRRLLDLLRPRERSVLIARYGLDGSKPSSLRDLSERVGMSREGVRQVEARALRKLRRAYRAAR